MWDSPAIKRSNHTELRQFLATHHIDHILLLNDAGSRDLGHLFFILNEILPTQFTEQVSNKLTIGLNHADVALSGHGWQIESAQPNNELSNYLHSKCKSVAKRLQENTATNTTPLYFCSGFKDEIEALSPYLIMPLIEHLLSMPGTLHWTQKLWQWFSQTHH